MTRATREDAAAAVGQRAVTWIDVDGVHDVALIARLGELFALHPLVVEDIVNTAQRPKAQDYGNVIYIVLKLLFWDPREDEIASDQISIVLGENFVISFSEQVGDEFQAVRTQLADRAARIRTLGAEYLAYRLTDSVIDGYFEILEDVGDAARSAGGPRAVERPRRISDGAARDQARVAVRARGHRGRWIN